MLAIATKTIIPTNAATTATTSGTRPNKQTVAEQPIAAQGIKNSPSQYQPAKLDCHSPDTKSILTIEMTTKVNSDIAIAIECRTEYWPTGLELNVEPEERDCDSRKHQSDPAEHTPTRDGSVREGIAIQSLHRSLRSDDSKEKNEKVECHQEGVNADHLR
jgi:hypothetical protein